MTDTFRTLPLTGSGDATLEVAVDSIAGVDHQYTKVEYGTSGTATPVDSTHPLPTINTAANTALGAQADAAWATGSGSIIAILKGIYGKVAGTLTVTGTVTATPTGIQAVSGTFWPTAQPITGEQLHLNAGARVSATATAGTLIAANTAGRERIIRNLDSANTVYVGPSGVTATNGIPVGPLQELVLTANNLLQVICATGQTASVYVAETIAV